MAVEINNKLREGDYKKIGELLSREMETNYVQIELLNEYMKDPVSMLEMGFISYSPNETMLQSVAFSCSDFNPNLFGELIMKNFMEGVESNYKTSKRETGDSNYKFTIEGDGVKGDVYSGFKNAFFKTSSFEPIQTDAASMESEILFTRDVLERGFNALYKAYGMNPQIELNLEFGKKKFPSTAVIHRKMKKENKKSDVSDPERLYPLFIDIGGCEMAKEELSVLATGLKDPEIFSKWGVRYPKGILLHGPPGTGKTMLAKAMGNQAGVSVYHIKGSDIHDKWYGNSEKNMKAVFDEARKTSPSIILIDEIDSIAPHRSGSHEVTKRVVSIMLQEMDGLESSDGVTIIGTTNYIENIDSAILRSGRFDELIEIPYPNESAREDIFRLHCNGKRVSEIDYKEMAKKTEGLSGADIESIVRIGLKKRMKNEIKTKEEQNPVTTKDLIDALEEYNKMRNNLPKGIGEYSYLYV